MVTRCVNSKFCSAASRALVLAIGFDVVCRLLMTTSGILSGVLVIRYTSGFWLSMSVLFASIAQHTADYPG